VALCFFLPLNTLVASTKKLKKPKKHVQENISSSTVAISQGLVARAIEKDTARCINGAFRCQFASSRL